MNLRYVPGAQLQAAISALNVGSRTKVSRALAAACRINVLYMVKRAGSGHLGTSFSCQDLVSWVFLNETTNANDIFFSSKGHDVPAFYAMLTALGHLPFEKMHALRRLGGLPGHPEVSLLPKLEANTGSLGMGISKAKGMLIAQRLQGNAGRIFVLTGDGELDEGQIWESLPSAVTQRMGELTVIVDHNKIQSDTWVKRVSDLGDLESKFRSFGWHVARCDGNDMSEIERTFGSLRNVHDVPKLVIADTIKGKGVSFMESFGPQDDFYQFHSGAPTDEQYDKALAELVQSAETAFRDAGLDGPRLESVDYNVAPSSPEARHKLVEAYGRALVRNAESNARVIAFDADLIKDCGLAEFARRFPKRLVECGIAEQDMVSQAGGAALKGTIPIVHSFSSFLSARPNEQIYTNATEGSKVIYVATLAGILPATPGHSHQAVREISSLGAMPNLVMIAPCSEPQTEAALDWAINVSRESTYLRLSSIPCILPFEIDRAPKLEVGRGTEVRPGSDVALVAYGPVMLAQAYIAAEALARTSISARVIDMPWLNRVDVNWLQRALSGIRFLFTIDDQYIRGGQGDLLLSTLAESSWPSGLRAKRIGLTTLPECGHNDEVLAHHAFDGPGIARTIEAALRT